MKFLSFLLLACLLVPAAARAEEGEKGSGPNDQLQSKGATVTAPEGKTDSGGPFYVNIAPFVLPVIDDNGPNQLISLVITLEMVDGKGTELVKQRLPRLNDAYLQTLYGALDQKLVDRGQLVDVGLVKKRLQAPTQRVLGDGVVKDILVQAVSQRKL